MPAARRPAAGDAKAARRILLAGLAGGAPVADLAAKIEALHPRNNTFPGEVFLSLAADALAWAGVSRSAPLPLERRGSGFCPSSRGGAWTGASWITRCWLQRPCTAGPEPDLLDEIAWWQADVFWQYALLAAVYVRAAADRVGVPVTQACWELAGGVGVVDLGVCPPT